MASTAGVPNPRDMLDVFRSLPASARAWVMRNPALAFSAYPRSLAAVTDRGARSVGGVPVADLFYGWMLLNAPPGSPEAAAVTRAVAQARAVVAPAGTVADDIAAFNNSADGRLMGGREAAEASAYARQFDAASADLARLETERRTGLINGVAQGVTGLVSTALTFAQQERLSDIQERRVQIEHEAAMASLARDRGSSQATLDLQRLALRLQANQLEERRLAQEAAAAAPPAPPPPAPEPPPAPSPPPPAPGVPTWAKLLLGGTVVIGAGAAGIAYFTRET